MVLPAWLAEWNKVGLNRATKRIAPWLPGFGVVEHRGRRSGRTYRTPMNVFRTGEGYVMALTYGADTDWVKNVLAAGGCDLVTRRRRVHLTSPEIYHDESRRHIRVVERTILRLADVADFIALKTAS